MPTEEVLACLRNESGTGLCPECVEVLEDLITVAIQDAMNRANSVAEEKMGAVTGGLRIPGLM